MAAPTSNPKTDPLLAFRQTMACLARTDDTSRFVGLQFLLMLVNSCDPNKLKDPDPSNEVNIYAIWNLISGKFIERLLAIRADESASTAGADAAAVARAKEDMFSMNVLAVSVVHMFCELLPPDHLNSEKMRRFIPGLLQNVDESRPDTCHKALECLVRICCSPEAAKKLFHDPRAEKIFLLAGKEPLAAHIVKQVACYAGGSKQAILRGSDQWTVFLANLLTFFHGQDKSTLVEILAVFLDQAELPPEFGDMLCLPRIFKAIRDAYTYNRSKRTFDACRRALYHLVRFRRAQFDPFFPTTTPPSQYKKFEEERLPPPSPPLKPQNSTSSDSFSYSFISYIIIDTQSTVPEIAENFGSAERYKELAERLSMNFEILRAYLESLSQLAPTLEGEEDVTYPFSLDITGEQLIKQSQKLNETASLVIELLNDRWEFEHPDTRLIKADSSGASGQPRIPKFSQPGPDYQNTSSRPQNLEELQRLIQQPWSQAQQSSSSSPSSSSTPQPRNAPTRPTGPPAFPFEQDPVVLSALPLLAVHITETDDPHLLSAASNLIPALLALYRAELNASSSAAAPARLRPSILCVVNRLLTVATEDGAAADEESVFVRLEEADGVSLLTADVLRALTDREVFAREAATGYVDGVLDALAVLVDEGRCVRDVGGAAVEMAWARFAEGVAGVDVSGGGLLDGKAEGEWVRVWVEAAVLATRVGMGLRGSRVEGVVRGVGERIRERARVVWEVSRVWKDEQGVMWDDGLLRVLVEGRVDGTVVPRGRKMREVDEEEEGEEEMTF